MLTWASPDRHCVGYLILRRHSIGDLPACFLRGQSIYRRRSKQQPFPKSFVRVRARNRLDDGKFPQRRQIGDTQQVITDSDDVGFDPREAGAARVAVRPGDVLGPSAAYPSDHGPEVSKSHGCRGKGRGGGNCSPGSELYGEKLVDTRGRTDRHAARSSPAQRVSRMPSSSSRGTSRASSGR